MTEIKYIFPKQLQSVAALLIRPFLDISTLSARLKAEECISTEFSMCDGSWHRMLFTVKKG